MAEYDKGEDQRISQTHRTATHDAPWSSYDIIELSKSEGCFSTCFSKGHEPPANYCSFMKLSSISLEKTEHKRGGTS